MPDYKKRKHRRLFSSPGRVKKSRVMPEDIKMSPKGAKPKSQATKNMRVVTGKKLEQRRKIKTMLPVLGAIAVLLIVLQLILPAGIPDTLSNSLALLGAGSFPIELIGSDVVDTVQKNSHFFILTDESVAAYSNSGKKLFSYSHGFEKPVIKTSGSRAVVFNQGANNLLLFDLNDLVCTLNTKNTIITAAVSDSGSFAVATRSDKYASAVTVYDKRGEETVYEWYSAEDTVNNVALSRNGKKLAVSVFNSAVGQYTSKLNVLNYNSATPEYTAEFENTLVYSIDTTHSGSFAAVTSNGIKFIKWSKYTVTDYKNEYNTAFFRAGKGGYLAVFNRESDKTDNRIAVFSKSGELKAEVQYKGIISDIKVYAGHIYCMSDTDIFLLSDEGKVLRSTNCGFGAVKINVTATNTVAVITDNKIEKFELEQEQ